MGHRPEKLQDSHGRRLTYMRLSVTDRCNLRCVYCMPGSGIQKVQHAQVLSYEELLRICRIAAELGIEKIRVTGGEPLVRSDMAGFLPRLAAVPGLSEVTLTTNGVLLGSFLDVLKSSNIRRINVSLDSLDRDRYRTITGRDFLPQVVRALKDAVDAGFNPVKINVVVMRGVNQDEVGGLAGLSLDRPFHVRFIEYMPMGGTSEEHRTLFVSGGEVKDRIEASFGPLEAVTPEAGDGPAMRFRINGSVGEVGFINAISNHFCSGCNRIRLTATGSLRTCLLSDLETDLKGPLRSGATKSELAEIFRKGVLLKPGEHCLGNPDRPEVNGCMSSIGG